jgi:hypothetical protein
VIRVFVLYAETPEPDAYEQHVELNRREVPGATIRHGRILGSAQGEVPDRDAWKQAQDGLLRAADDAQGLGVPFRVYFAELEG